MPGIMIFTLCVFLPVLGLALLAVESASSPPARARLRWITLLTLPVVATLALAAFEGDLYALLHPTKVLLREMLFIAVALWFLALEAVWVSRWVFERRRLRNPFQFLPAFALGTVALWIVTALGFVMLAPTV